MGWQPLGRAVIAATASVSLSLTGLKPVCSDSVPMILWNFVEQDRVFPLKYSDRTLRLSHQPFSLEKESCDSSSD